MPDNPFRVDYEIDSADSSSGSEEGEEELVLAAPAIGGRGYHLHHEMDNTDEIYAKSDVLKRPTFSERIHEVEGEDNGGGGGGGDDGTQDDVGDILLQADLEQQLRRRQKNFVEMSPTQLRFNWLKKQVLRPPNETLRESCAKALAASWSDGSPLKAHLEDLKKSPMTSLFKAEVGVYLQGHLLASFVNHEGGLEKLMLECGPEVFQRLLTAVYKEISRFDQKPQARKALSRCIRIFREKTERHKILHPAVHRLGLTRSFSILSLDDFDDLLLFHYWLRQAEPEYELRFVPPLRYPLPYSLRNIDTASVMLFGSTCYNMVPALVQQQQQWRFQAGRGAEGSEVEMEERGLAQSKCSAEFRQQTNPNTLFWMTPERQSSFTRYVLLLEAVSTTHINGGFQPVLALSFVTLTDSSIVSPEEKRAEERQRARLLRADVYRYMARSLCWLHAYEDLPLACLEKMKNLFSEMQPLLCLGDWGRLVLTQMEILVKYGHYKPARNLFWNWFGRFPSTGWIHEELVMIYSAGVLSAVQEELLELKLTTLLHENCRNVEDKDLGCWKKHVVPLLRSTKTQLLLLKSILLRSLSDLTLQEDFRRDCNNALTLCQVYLLIHKRADVRDFATNRGHFHHYYFRIRWNDCNFNSPHLRAFLWPIPESVINHYCWTSVQKKILEEETKTLWQNSTHQENPRVYPDFLFTLLASALFFEDAEKIVRNLISDTETAYIKSTAGRHHRIPILRRLLIAYDNPKETKLQVHPSLDFSDPEIQRQAGLPHPAPSIIHPGLRNEDLTGAKTVQRRIEEFAEESLCDALRGFESADLRTDQTFCAYLRSRDALVDVHLDVGLRVLRFATKI